MINENGKLITKLLPKQQVLNLNFDEMLLKGEIQEYEEVDNDFYITKTLSDYRARGIRLNSTVIQKAQKLVQHISNFRVNNTDKNELYRKFRIPKRKGGFRNLIEPREDLKILQKDVLNFIQYDLRIQVHHSAHAFVKSKDAYTNAYQHKDSNCFITLDIKNFFPSINEAILKNELNRNAIIYALNYRVANFIDEVVWLATYEDVLPQGSPLSPFLSNIVMHIFDYTVSYQMSLGLLPRYKYTRYADDMCFSAKKFSHIGTFINSLKELLNQIYGQAIKINEEKTKLLTKNNKCYITGVKINKDNNATYGHENKKKLKLQLFNIFQGLKFETVTKEEVQEVLGRFSYMSRIEPDYAKYLERKLLKEFNSSSETVFKHFKEILR